MCAEDSVRFENAGVNIIRGMMVAAKMNSVGFAPLREFPDFQRRIAVNNAVFECGIKDGAEMNQPNSVL